MAKGAQRRGEGFDEPLDSWFARPGSSAHCGDVAYARADSVGSRVAETAGFTRAFAVSALLLVIAAPSALLLLPS